MDSPDYYITYEYKDVYVDGNNLVRISKVEGIQDIAKAYFCAAMAPGFISAAQEFCTPPAQDSDINFGYKFQIQLEDSQRVYAYEDGAIVEGHYWPTGQWNPRE